MMIAMSESCSKVLETLKLLLTDPNTYNPFCIGTSDLFWKTIKTDGLTPVVCSSGGSCSDTTYSDVNGRNLNRVWIGRAGHKMCSVYARRAVNKSAGNPLKITFNTHLQQSGMRPSKEYIENNYFNSESADVSDIPKASILLNEAKANCSPEDIKMMLESLPDWSKSLIANKNANFVSMVRINPIAIENIEESEPLSSQWND